MRQPRGTSSVDEVPMKRIEENWILITYDIPRSEGSLRKRVLRRLHKIGAIQFTESVYYMPYNPASLKAARDVSEGGEIIVWFSKVEGADAALLTKRYILKIAHELEVLKNKIWEAEEEVRTSQQLHPWVLKELNMEYRGLVKAVEGIGERGLAERLGDVRRRLEALKSHVKKAKKLRKNEGALEKRTGHKRREK